MHNWIDFYEYLKSPKVYGLFHSVDSLWAGLENSFRAYLSCLRLMKLLPLSKHESNFVVL